jgi:hypothetical protein
MYDVIALIICFIKLCVLLSGDIEQNPGPTQGDTTGTLQSSISICHLNIRSLRNKIDDIVHIVEDFDIVCFTETHFDQRGKCLVNIRDILKRYF